MTTQYQLSGWDLTELLPEPTDELISARLAELEQAAAAVEAQRPALSPALEPAALLSLVQQLEQISRQMYVLGAYGSLWFSADTQSTAAMTYMNRIQQT